MRPLREQAANPAMGTRRMLRFIFEIRTFFHGLFPDADGRSPVSGISRTDWSDHREPPHREEGSLKCSRGFADTPPGPFAHYASTEPIFRPAGLRGPCLQPRKGLGNPRPRTPKPLSTVLEHGAIALVRALPRSLPRGGSRPLPVPRLQRHQDQRSLLAPTQPRSRVSGQPIPGPHRARAGRVRTLRPGLTRGGMVATAARPAIPSPPDTAPNPALAVGLAESPEEFRSPSRPAFRILPACST